MLGRIERSKCTTSPEEFTTGYMLVLSRANKSINNGLFLFLARSNLQRLFFLQRLKGNLQCILGAPGNKSTMCVAEILVVDHRGPIVCVDGE